MKKVSVGIASLCLSALTPLTMANEPTLLLIGGALNDNTEIISRFVDLAGNSNGKIGVITAGSFPYPSDCQTYGTSTSGGCNDPTVSNSKMNANYYVDLFESYGIDAEWIPIDIDTIENANDPTVVAQIQSSTGLFFSGGDQSRYLTSFIHNGADSAAMTAIRNGFNSGNTVLAGSSAGTAVMADTMISGGTSYHALRYGAYEYGTEVDADDLTYIQPGFALFDYGVLDTHFAERGRQGRIIELALSRNIDTAWGIDEETALLIVGANGTANYGEVIGVGGVHRFDLSNADLVSTSRYELYDVRWSYATDGDFISLYDGSIMSNKPSPILSGSARGTSDLFSTRTPRAMIDMAISLVRSNSTVVIGSTSERRPRFRGRLVVGSQFAAFGDTNPSFQHLILDLYDNRLR